MHVLFTSAHSLGDPGSGAARSVATLLRALARGHHRVRALTGSLLDSPAGWEALQALPVTGGVRWRGTGAGRLDARRRASLGFEETILTFPDWRPVALASLHEQALASVLAHALGAERPDLLLTYGGLNFNRVALALARHRGVRTAFYLASPTYRDSTVFEQADVLLCASGALRERLGLAGDPRCEVTGSFVELAQYEVAERSGEFVLFCNPRPEKGLAVFAAVAALSQRRADGHRFLVLESRATWEQACGRLPALRALRNVTVMPPQADVRAAYARTWALLYPSLWFEPSGRMPLEAAVNRIPVLAHDVGGVRECFPAAAAWIEAPPASVRDPQAPVGEAVAARWLDALDTLRADPRLRAEACERALAYAKTRDAAAIVARIEPRLFGYPDAPAPGGVTIRP